MTKLKAEGKEPWPGLALGETTADRFRDPWSPCLR
jgi:hypothetical protein